MATADQQIVIAKHVGLKSSVRAEVVTKLMRQIVADQSFIDTDVKWFWSRLF